MCLALATCLLSCAFVSLAIVWGAYDLHQDRAAALVPRICDRPDATALYEFGGLDQVSFRPVTVIVIAPLSEDAPLPPGLSAWPGPGEAAVSPALGTDLTGDLAGRYGHVTSRISLEGLETPQERRVYMRPLDSSLRPSDMEPICGFGTDARGTPYAGEGSLYAAHPGDVSLLLVLSLIVPAVGAVVIAARLKDEESQRRSAALISMGMRRRDLAIVDLVGAAPALAAGHAMTCALIGIALTTDIHVAWLDSSFPAADTRKVVGPMAMALIAGMLLSVLIVMVAGGHYRRPLLRSRSERMPTRLSPLVLLLTGILLAVWFPLWNPMSPNKLIVYFAGVLLVIIGLPGVIDAACRGVGMVVARAGLRWSRPSLLLAGRQVGRLSRTSRHLAVGIGLAVIMGGQIQLWVGALAPQYLRAEEQISDWGQSIAMVSGEPDDVLSVIRPRLAGSGTDLVQVMVEETTTEGGVRDVVTVAASCAVLTGWNQRCEPHEVGGQDDPLPPYVLAQVPELTAFDDVRVVVATDSAMTASTGVLSNTVYLVSSKGNNLDLASWSRTLNRLLPGAQISSVTDQWMVAGTVTRLQSRWTIVFGAVGIGTVCLVLGCALVLANAHTAELFARLSVVAGAGRTASRAAAWRTALVTVLTGGVSTVLYAVLPLGMAQATDDSFDLLGRPSPAYSIMCLALTGTTAIIVAIMAGTAARAAQRRWQP